eukprot:Selendium_serpulae@DN589_c0_g1_i2.p1
MYSTANITASPVEATNQSLKPIFGASPQPESPAKHILRPSHSPVVFACLSVFAPGVWAARRSRTDSVAEDYVCSSSINQFVGMRGDSTSDAGGSRGEGTGTKMDC